MFFNKIVILVLLIFISTCAYAAGIFDYPIAPKDVAEKLPELKSVECTFEQEKVLNNRTLKSGGNFKFIKDKGVIFETFGKTSL